MEEAYGLETSQFPYRLNYTNLISIKKQFLQQSQIFNSRYVSDLVETQVEFSQCHNLTQTENIFYEVMTSVYALQIY